MSDSIIRGLLNQGKAVRNIEEPWWSRQATSTIGAVERGIREARKWKDRKLTDTGENLQSLLQVIDGEEGMELFDKRLQDYSSSASNHADHALQAEVLGQIAKRKKEMIGNFSQTIKDAVSLTSSDDFLDTAEEFQDIQATMKKKGIKGSVSDFLQSELSNVNNMLDNLAPGFNVKDNQIIGTNFKSNLKAVDDKAIYRKLNKYREQLSLATTSLTGDGKISIDEAEAIIIGDPKHYDTTKRAALSKAEKNYNYNKNMAVKFAGLINTAKQKKINDLQEGLFDAGADENTIGSLLGSANAGAWDKVIADLKIEKDEYVRYRNEANKNYENWYGSPYESIQGGATLDDIVRVSGDETDEDDSGEEGKEVKEEIGESLTDQEYNILQDLQQDTEVEVADDTVEINNPGNLKFMNQKGSKGKDNRGFAIFPTAEEGWDALYRQIELDKGRDLTLDKFIHKYAPPNENDTIGYRNEIQRKLNVGKNTNINKIDTKKLAVAIAQQEGYAGEYPKTKDPKPKSKIKIDQPLTKMSDGKNVVNYSTANTSSFKSQQNNLKKIALQKYNTKENKNKHSNVDSFVKSKFKEWLDKNDKVRAANWWTKGKYREEDFIYFMPTKVDRNNKINPNKDMNFYNLYYPPAFSGAEGDVRMMVKPKIKDGSYLQFAKDFDAFRKFLQES